MKSIRPEYLKKAKLSKLPVAIGFEWVTGEKNLPKEFGIYAVCVVKKDTKLVRLTFAEFVPCRLPNCKIDYDEWRVLGAIHNESFARGSEDNWFDVVAWARPQWEKRK